MININAENDYSTIKRLILPAEKIQNMFFVGATGQLLTLILTVSIPFMMLVTGHQKVELYEKQISFDIEHLNRFEINIDNQTHFSGSDFVAENKKCHTIFNFVRVLKTPPDKFRVSWKMIYLEYVGNKAPPLTFLF